MSNSKRFLLWTITILNIVMIFVAIYLAITVFITGNDPDKRLSSHFATIFLSIIPLIYLLVKKDKVNLFIFTFYSIYMFLAVFLGASLNFYNNYEGIHYDKIIHVFFGYASALVGLIILIKLKQFEGSSLLFKVLFLFSFAMMIAAVWELTEFASDQLLGTTTQGIPVMGLTDVGETMYDILANLIGSLLFIIPFTLNQKGKRSLLMSLVVDNLLE